MIGLRRIVGCIAVSLLAALGCGPGGDECEMLFVQQGAGVSSSETQLTLHGASPDLIFFCDRPERTAGHLTWDAFMALVAEGENSFADDPPNAAVSVIGSGGEVAQAVVTLTAHPTRRGSDITFPMSILEGEVPAEGGTTILFIDPIGRPMSPTSVAGVHRRHRRRAIRHIR
jgi:hypothetical protein